MQHAYAPLSISEDGSPTPRSQRPTRWRWVLGSLSGLLILSLLALLERGQPSRPIAKSEAGDGIPPRVKSQLKAAFVVMVDPTEDVLEYIVPTLRNVEEHYGCARGRRRR